MTRYTETQLRTQYLNLRDALDAAKVAAISPPDDRDEIEDTLKAFIEAYGSLGDIIEDLEHELKQLDDPENRDPDAAFWNEADYRYELARDMSLCDVRPFGNGVML